MTKFRKTIALGLVAASLGMGAAATSTPAAAWDFQNRNIYSGFNNWDPSVGWVAAPTTYDAFEPKAYEPSCYLTAQTAFGKNGFAYYAIERVCH
jgi:hypothetical protein